MIPLKMPGLWGEITVKIVGLGYKKKDGVYLPVIMWGDPKKFEFEMKLTKTIWFSIYEHLIIMEIEPLNQLMGDDGFKIDNQLSCLKDRILTIRAIPDKSSKGFVGKDGKVGYPKIFEVMFRYDLEEAERFGLDSEEYRSSVFKHVIDNLSSRECRLLNTATAKNDLIKKENKEKEKEIVEVEWVKKKKEEDKKKDKKVKKTENYWKQFE